MRQFVHRLFRLEPGEWPKLLQFGLFGFLLQVGLGIGFSAGDAAFLSNVGADSLPLVFLLTPVVMLVYTAVFSYLTVRFSIGTLVSLTLALLIAGGAVLWALIETGLPPEWERTVYFALKLYLAVWYIGLYTLFWNFTDSYFDIQDAKRLFPLFAAFCASGTATGAMLVSLLADMVAMHNFFLGWAVLAFLTAPVARFLQSRWEQIAESDLVTSDEVDASAGKLAGVGRTLVRSRYAMVLALTLFVTLLMTNLAEFQYSMVLQEGRSEAELASLFGALYAAANLFNMLVCLLLFNRLVARIGVRNVALIQPLTYFAVFGYFFLEGGAAAAFAAFFAYHGVLTSIQYNNENLLFNALPSEVKRPLRTVIEGICEPAASLAAGGFLLYWSDILDIRELSGVGIIVGLVLLGVVVVLRQQYPPAMAANMQRSWLNFGESNAGGFAIDGPALQRLEAAAEKVDTRAGRAANRLLMAQYKARDHADGPTDVDALVRKLDGTPEARAAALDGLGVVTGEEHIHLFPRIARILPELDAEQRHEAIGIIGRISDTEMIPEILAMAENLAPRDRRAVVAILVDQSATAIPRLARAIGDSGKSYRLRSMAARALADLSFAQFSARLDRLVEAELRGTGRLLQSADLLEAHGREDATLPLIARAQRERVEAAVDFALELLSLGRKLPDADLLIVSLHSSNAKVRGNAIEAIENGVDHDTFAFLRSLLEPRKSEAMETAGRSLDAVLEEALLHGRPVEVAGALEVLISRLPRAELLRRVQPLLATEMPAVVREQVGPVFGLASDQRPSAFATLKLLASSRTFGAAPLNVLLALAECARTAEPGKAAHCETDGVTTIWLAQSDIDAVAARYPALALVLLRSKTAVRHAA
ncbi:MAG: MFS transporter [Erythrobacter sp.]